MMDFSEALRRMKLGAKLHRQAIRDRHEESCWCEVDMTKKLLLLCWESPRLPTGMVKLLWHPYAEDILADDWIDPAE